MAHKPQQQSPRPRMRPVVLSPELVDKVWAICGETGDAFDDVVADAIALHHDELLGSDATVSP